MISLHPTLFYLLLEALAGVTVIALILGLLAIRRRRYRRTALVDLVHRIKNTGDARRESLGRVLRESGAPDDERLTALTQQVLTAETHFYQFLVRALLSGNDRSLLDLDRHVELLTEAITRCSPSLKNIPAKAGSAQPPATTEINAELGQIRQVVAALQSNHQQVLAEIQSSVASVRDTLNQFASQGVVAVATAASAGNDVSAPAAPPVSSPASGASMPMQDALESLPDIDDAMASAPVSVSTAPSTAPAPVVQLDAPNIDQIAEIPDELLMGSGATFTDAAKPQAAPDNTVPELADASAASTAAGLDQTLAAMDSIATILDDSPVDAAPKTVPPPPAAPAPPASTVASSHSLSDAAALIDDLLADAATSSKATLAATQVSPGPGAANVSPKPELSVDEIYAAAPLIPDMEGQSPPAPSTQAASAMPATGSAAAGNDQQQPSQSKSYGNVDDLLAELDDLLK